MKVFGIVGWSGSGKTTLAVRLVPEFTARGLTVSTIKHAHHVFDVDQPGKDSYRHRTAGASEVLVASTKRWVLMRELADELEPDLDGLLSHMTPVDLVLVEGYKHHAHDKIEVHRPSLGQPLVAPTDPSVIAIACDNPPDNTDGLAAAILDLNDTAAITQFILSACELDSHLTVPVGKAS